MLKSQFIIILLAIVAVIFLFTLPKVVVNNKQPEAQRDKQHPTSTSEEKPKEIHSVSLSEENLKQINLVRTQLENFSDKEKKLTFADSLAEIFRGFHLYDSSAKYFLEAAEIAPSVKNWLKAGTAFYEAASSTTEADRIAASSEKAREFYNKALVEEPGNLDIKNKIAATYMVNNDAMQAVVILREIVGKDPENIQALTSLGLLSIQSGQYDKAIARFEKILSFAPEDATAYFYLGVAYVSKGDKTKGKSYLLKAKELSGDAAFDESVDAYLKEIK